MERPLVQSPQKPEPAPVRSDDTLQAQKRQIRALKRVLIAKAEVRRLKSLIGRHRVKAG